MSDDHDHSQKAQALAAELLVASIRPLLAGLPPEIVGAVLGELTATYIAGHAPDLRAETHQMLIDLTNDLVPVVVETLIANKHAPAEWRASKPN
jgi:hypothetical protein